MNRYILVVDDHDNVRVGLRLLLEAEGYKVLEAKDGQHALEVLKLQKPDAIICDVEMPFMDGFQFRRVLLQNHELAHIPFFFLTAHTTVAETVYGLDLEVDDYIPKSISATILRKKLENVIRKRESERELATLALQQASSEVALQLLPELPPSISGYVINHFHKPYKQTPGGDFYDYISLNEHATFIVLGDVMGKQWRAWMFAQAYIAYVRSTIRSMLSVRAETLTPADILYQLNKTLCCDKKTSDILWTLSIVHLTHHSNQLLYASAAHTPSLLLRGDTLDIQSIDHGSPPIGYSEDMTFQNYEFTMSKGDILLMLTDGIAEAENKEQIPYGEKALPDALIKYRDDTNLGESIYNDALFYVGGETLQDDSTMIVIKKT